METLCKLPREARQARQARQARKRGVTESYQWCYVIIIIARHLDVVSLIASLVVALGCLRRNYQSRK